MAKNRSLSKTEKVAFANMTFRLAEYYHIACAQDVAGEYHDSAQSNFEELSCFLYKLKILEQSPIENVYDNFRVPIDKIIPYVIKRKGLCEDHFAEGLSAFLVNSIDYNLKSSLTASMGAFEVDSLDIELMDLAVSLGWSKKYGKIYEWTDKVVPIMLRWYFWEEVTDEDGTESLIERTTIYDFTEEDKSILAAQAFVKLPWTVKRRLRYVFEKHDQLNMASPNDSNSSGHTYNTGLYSKKQLKAVRIMEQHWNGRQFTFLPNSKDNSLQTYLDQFSHSKMTPPHDILIRMFELIE